MRQDIEQLYNNFKTAYAIKGASCETIYPFYELANVAITKEKQVEDGKAILFEARELIESLIYPVNCGEIERVRNCWKFVDDARDNNIDIPEISLYLDILLLLAQNKDFDSYLLFLEHKRQQKDRFYLPKRKQLRHLGLIQALQDMIDDKLDILTISMPPGTGKTTLSKFFMSAIIGWRPKEYNIFWSHSADIARMYYDGVYDFIVNNDEYAWQEVFPDLFVTSTNAKMGMFNVGKYKPFQSLQVTSSGAENAGKIRASGNGFLMIDDLIGKLEEALNINILEKLWRTYSTDAKQRKKDGCKEIHIATRWSVHDPIGKLERIYEGNKKMRTKFIAVPDIDEKTGKSNFDYEFEGFTVDFFNDQSLTMDEITYKCLYKNQPIEREGLLYHEEDLMRYLSLPLNEPDAILANCDVKNKGIDFMFQPIYLQYGDMFYLVDCVCDDNTDFEIQYERLSDMLVEYRVQSAEYESNTGGDRVGFEVEKRVKDKGWNTTITLHPTETNKEARIIANNDWVKRHIYFRDKSLYERKSDYGRMMDMLLTYSVVGKNKNDDVQDGLANFRLFVDRMQPRLATVSAAFNPFRSGGMY